MDFRELKDNLTKFLPTTNPMLEFADSRFCGIELTDDICA